jgi:NAD(P)-dependent dehydrogenase (short-subunit alcohol dehydrogenase family)
VIDGVLSGRAALVTGGGRGIGRSTALALARAGARVAVAARTLSEIEAVSARCGEGAIAVRLDVTSSDSCREAVAACESEFGRLDVLINNAGVASSQKFTDLTEEIWRETMAVDLDGPYRMTKAAVPGMVARGWGAVIMIGSTRSLTGGSYLGAYTAAKHGLLGLTRALALEYAKKGLTFNCVCPSFTETPMTRHTVENIMAKTGRDEEAALKALYSGQGRLISPEEIAALCVYLASEEGHGINGQAIAIDGGIPT